MLKVVWLYNKCSVNEDSSRTVVWIMWFICQTVQVFCRSYILDITDWEVWMMEWSEQALGCNHYYMYDSLLISSVMQIIKLCIRLKYLRHIIACDVRWSSCYIVLYDRLCILFPPLTGNYGNSSQRSSQ